MDCSSVYATTNADISGPGVRVSFYLQTFFLVLLVDRSWEDAPTALWTFTATSFGLTIAAIANRKELTFFQALQVSNLVWLANLGTFVALASYSRQKARSRRSHLEPRRSSDYHVKFGAMIQTLLSMALTIYMWGSAKTFGPSALAPCTSLIRYVLLFIKLPALGSGRIVGLLFSSLLMLGYAAVSLHEMRSYWNSRVTRDKARRDVRGVKGADLELGHKPREARNTPSSSPQAPPTLASSSSQSSHLRALNAANNMSPQITAVTTPSSVHAAGFPGQGDLPKQTGRRRGRRQWSASSDLDPMFVGILICQLLVFTYFIVSSELLLLYNRAGDGDGVSNDIIGFGQILALVVVLPSLLSVIGALRKHGLRPLDNRRNRKKKKRTRKKGSS